MQVLLKLQQSKNRSRDGDVYSDRVFNSKKRNMLPDPGGSAITPAPSLSFGLDASSESRIIPSLAFLCSYDDNSDASESIASHQVPSSTVVAPAPVESKPTLTACQPLIRKSKSFSDMRVPSYSGKDTHPAIPMHQSKVLARTGRCNLLDKLLQKEANADLRTILLCFRAFASRGLV
jgi:hypothetical protein